MWVISIHLGMKNEPTDIEREVLSKRLHAWTEEFCLEWMESDIRPPQKWDLPWPWQESQLGEKDK